MSEGRGVWENEAITLLQRRNEDQRLGQQDRLKRSPSQGAGRRRREIPARVFVMVTGVGSPAVVPQSNLNLFIV
eukprot:759529-Hanusia_phi.AAC.3